VATSKDLLIWEKQTTLNSEQPCEENGFCAPGAIVIGGKVHLFYQTYGNQKNDAICHAWSEDGLHFTRDPSNPIFRPHGDWTCGRAIDAEVFPDGERLLLYFASRDPSYKTQLVGVASAAITSDFSRSQWSQLADRAILRPELPWEKDCIEAPTLLRHGSSLFMFYAGAYNNWPQQIGCAVSGDGIEWKRLSDQPLLAVGKPGSWNSSESGHPGVFTDTDGQTYLFYQGNADHGKSWFLSKVKVDWKDNMPTVSSN
jgi:sucrose-6-phosphate hydrolase SacC (GH32 family)